MRPTAAALVAPVLALALLTGCGGTADSSTSASSPSATISAKPPGAGTPYCTLLQTDLTALFNHIHGPKDADTAVTMIRRVAAAAPAEVKDDWATIGGSLGQLRSALARAARLQKDQKAGKLNQKQLKRATASLLRQTQALSTPKTQAAGTAVVEHATRYCGIALKG
jgi:hypothetical protein